MDKLGNVPKWWARIRRFIGNVAALVSVGLHGICVMIGIAVLIFNNKMPWDGHDRIWGIVVSGLGIAICMWYVYIVLRVYFTTGNADALAIARSHPRAVDIKCIFMAPAWIILAGVWFIMFAFISGAYLVIIPDLEWGSLQLIVFGLIGLTLITVPIVISVQMTFIAIMLAIAAGTKEDKFLMWVWKHRTILLPCMVLAGGAIGLIFFKPV